jgi:UDP-glucose 4-epimerase
MVTATNALNNKRVLITGGAGYIGRWLVHALKDLTAAEIVVVDCNSRYLQQLSQLANPPHVRLLRCDLSHEKQVAEIASEIARANLIVHLAAILSTSRDVAKDGQAEFVNNILPLIHLLRYTSDRLEALCFTSSMAVYGYPRQLPVAETHPTDPIWLYGLSKLSCEKLLQMHAARYPVNVVSLRICGVYGRDTLDHRNAIPTFIRRALKDEDIQVSGDGRQVRDYVHMDDVIRGIVLALGANRSGIYNLGSGEGWPIRKMARFVIQQSASSARLHFVPARKAWSGLDYISDIALIKQDLQFQPAVSVSEGVVTEIEWIRNHGGVL